MQLPKRLHIPIKLENNASYLLIIEDKIFSACFDTKSMKQTEVEQFEDLNQHKDFCWHNVNLLIDPRQSKSSWQEKKARNHNIFSKRYKQKRSMYIAEVCVDSASSIVSQCDRSLMEHTLNTPQLMLAEITKCIDGVVGFSALPSYFGTNLVTQVFICISQSHIFLCAYTDQTLRYFSHIYLDTDVADLRSIVLHDVIPVLREYKILDNSDRLTVINFSNEEDIKLEKILREDLNLHAMDIQSVESFERFIINTSIYAKHQNQAKLVEYFNQFMLPIIPWYITNALMAALVLFYSAFTLHTVYKQQTLRNKWEATYQDVNAKKGEQSMDFVAVRSSHSDLMMPKLDSIINVLLVDVPNYAWLQSLLIQFDAKKFLVQGWARTQETASETTVSIYEFVRRLAETLGVNESTIRVDNTDGQRLIDIMSVKVSSRSRAMSLSPSTNINLNNLDNNRSMAATGFQGSNIQSGEKINLIPIKIGNRL